MFDLKSLSCYLLNSESMAVAGDLIPLKTKLYLHGLTTSKFVCTTEQRGRSGQS